MIDKTKQVVNSEYESIQVFSQNQKKDPLPHALKVAYMRKMFPRHKSSIIADKDVTAINIAVKLYDQGLLNMMVGSDRVKNLKHFRNYNGWKERHGYYRFQFIDVVSDWRKE